MDRKFQPLSPQQCVGEASRLARFLIEYERRPDGLNMAEAISRAENRWRFPRHTLQRLRYKPQELSDVRASTLDGLRCAYEELYEEQRRRIIAERELAEAMKSRELGPLNFDI